MHQESYRDRVPSLQFRGFPRALLPDYMEMRLQNFFESAHLAHDREAYESRRAPTWGILILMNEKGGPRCEWTEFPVEDTLPWRFDPERYGYCDGKAEYTVSVVLHGSKDIAIGPARHLFSFLKQHEREFVSHPEVLSRMHSFTLYRGYRMLSGDGNEASSV